MKVLALNTSTEHCSLALWLDGVVAERDVLAGQNHTELILPMLQALLAETGMQLEQLDGIAFGSGPGSFTGLRIGCGIAQGLAYGANLPVAGICTLEALAEGSGAERVIACLDARMGEIYHAAYIRNDEGWQTLSMPGLYAPAAAPAVEGGGWAGAGSGFAEHGAALLARYEGQLQHVDAMALPHARDIARLAVSRLELGQGVAAWDAAPLYVRDKIALKTSER